MAQPPQLIDMGPAREYFAITPSDTVGYTLGFARGIYVGGSGNVSLVSPQGTAVVFAGVVAGTILQVCSVRVNATNTTATALVGLV